MEILCSSTFALVEQVYVSQLSTSVTWHLGKIELKERKFVFIHSYKGFSPWLGGSINLRPVELQNIMAGDRGWLIPP